ncbi:MAG TPA: 6-phosphogluconolactonase [Pyrinomonadaceae bacterium]|jgi:6-phosphogluconolactonase|nr:6-phosphogluconolactonase [Pyrinomonadaceae bacterium]
MQANEPNPNVQVFDDPELVAREAAGLFVRLSIEAVAACGVFSVALSGGSTPRRIYELLASDDYRTQVSWPSVHIFFGDERTVPPDHADSNYRMANEAMLSQVPVPLKNVHRMNGVGDAAASASEYESELRAFFGDRTWPRLDLVMLGMGDDGHTASLFPGSAALEEQSKWVTANWVEKFQTWRITLSAPAINAARHVLFLVTGAGKAERLREVLKGEREPARLPSQLIQPSDGTLSWFLDRAAAAKLEGV